jgi:hypothetical protein
MSKIGWILSAALALAAGSEAQAQLGGCVRDALGALQCTLQRSPQQGIVAPLHRIPRSDLSADALRRSNALAERRRELIDQQHREIDEQRARLRQDCIDRALASGQKGGCRL